MRNVPKNAPENKLLKLVCELQDKINSLEADRAKHLSEIERLRGEVDKFNSVVSELNDLKEHYESSLSRLRELQDEYQGLIRDTALARKEFNRGANDVINYHKKGGESP